VLRLTGVFIATTVLFLAGCGGARTVTVTTPMAPFTSAVSSGSQRPPTHVRTATQRPPRSSRCPAGEFDPYGPQGGCFDTAHPGRTSNPVSCPVGKKPSDGGCATSSEISRGSQQCAAGESRDGAGNCVTNPASCPAGTEQNAAGQCNAGPSPANTVPGEPVCPSKAHPYYSYGQCYATPQTTPVQTTTTPVSCASAQTYAENISCNASGQERNPDAGMPNIVCPSGMSVYWRYSNLFWCAQPSGPFDNACAPDQVYADSTGGGYSYGPIGPSGLAACSNDTPARPFHDPDAGIP
jgi:hypothetical protein